MAVGCWLASDGLVKGLSWCVFGHGNGLSWCISGLVKGNGMSLLIRCMCFHV